MNRIKRRLLVAAAPAGAEVCMSQKMNNTKLHKKDGSFAVEWPSSFWLLVQLNLSRFLAAVA
jgi:hypothetical protein